jgi:zinc transport system permease protein
MIDAFLIYALLAALIVGVSASLVGCFVIWRRMAFFGDSLAHSGFLGATFGILYGLDIKLTVLVSCALFAVLLLVLQQQRVVSGDSLLGILAHVFLATGLVMLGLGGISGVDIHGFLFGDMLAIQSADLWWALAGCGLSVMLVLWFWNDLLLVSINEDLARAEGKQTLVVNIALMVAMTAVTAVAVHIVGALLVSALLVIPAASARNLTSSPEQMALVAVAISGVGAVVGVVGAYYLDIAPAPLIVMVLALVFFVAMPLRYGLGRWGRGAVLPFCNYDAERGNKE